MDYVALKFELLDLLFSDRPSREVSRFLGYSFDQVHRWKSGRKEMRWSEFCAICERLDKPLAKALRDVFQYHPKDAGDYASFVRHFREFYLAGSLQQLSEKLGFHLSILKRVFSGEVSPSLELVFALIDHHPMLLGSFLMNLLGPVSRGPILTGLFRDYPRAELETTYPLACAIEGLLALREYREMPVHDENWFCAKLSLDRSDFRQIWERLLRSRQVVADGDGKFHVSYQTIHTNGVSDENVCKMVAYWSDRAKARFLASDHVPVNRNKGPNVVAYRITPMSASTAEKATEIFIKAYQEVLSLVEADSGPFDDVRVILFHHFSVEDSPS